MHRPGRITKTGTGSSATYMLDGYVGGYALVGNVTDGTVTNWKVQVTSSDLQRGETAVWQDHADLTGKSGNAKGNLEFVPRALKTVITTGTGTLELDILPNGAV